MFNIVQFWSKTKLYKIVTSIINKRSRLDQTVYFNSNPDY